MVQEDLQRQQIFQGRQCLTAVAVEVAAKEPVAPVEVVLEEQGLLPERVLLVREFPQPDQVGVDFMESQQEKLLVTVVAEL